MKIVTIYSIHPLGNLLGIGLMLYVWITHIEQEIGNSCNYWRPIKTVGDSLGLSLIPTICIGLVIFNLIMMLMFHSLLKE